LRIKLDNNFPSIKFCHLLHTVLSDVGEELMQIFHFLFFPVVMAATAKLHFTDDSISMPTTKPLFAGMM
jgi:hypothetical protein